MIYGYIRISTEKQNLDSQHFEIKAYAKHNNLKINQWVEEIISSRKPLEKRKFGHLLTILQKDDIIIASELSRLGRNLLEIMQILQLCLEKECQVWTIKENYKLGSDISSKVLAFAFGLSAEIERQLISERTKASLAKLKHDGKKLGRPYGVKNRRLKLHKNKQKVQFLLQAGIPKNKIAQLLEVDRTTLRRFIQELPDTTKFKQKT